MIHSLMSFVWRKKMRERNYKEICIYTVYFIRIYFREFTLYFSQIDEIIEVRFLVLGNRNLNEADVNKNFKNKKHIILTKRNFRWYQRRVSCGD